MGDDDGSDGIELRNANAGGTAEAVSIVGCQRSGGVRY